MTVRAALAATVTFLGAAAGAWAHTGNPNFESTITSVRPANGLSVQVLNRDDRLELRNESGLTVVVFGYDDEPYARIRPDGTVQVNRRSSATYINEDRYGAVRIPASVDPQAPPRWRTLDRTGRFEWHDHRIHWMSKKVPPPQVRDESKRTKVYDWSVPLRVGAGAGAISGRLFWTPRDDGGGPPAAAIAVLALVAIGGLAAVIATRPRRRRSDGGDTREAW